MGRIREEVRAKKRQNKIYKKRKLHVYYKHPQIEKNKTVDFTEKLLAWSAVKKVLVFQK